MSEHARIQEAIDYILKNWQKGENLNQIAGRFTVDPGNLDREFKKRHTVPVKEFVDQRRKEYVLPRIAQGPVFGKELARELGFPTEMAFYRWISRVFGVSFRALKNTGSLMRMRKRGYKKL
jgi:methylphosphotriester-DNA--protein-cysteine methyltransferase